jgi:hypothetical protein
MSPSDREFARLGLKADLVQKLESAGLGSDEAKRLIGNQYRRRQIAPFFEDDAALNRFAADVEAETRMFETRRALGGSDAARRAAEDVATLGGAFLDAAHAGVHMAGGSPWVSLRALGRLAERLRSAPRSPEVNAEIARLLVDPIVGGTQPSASMKLLQEWQAFNNARQANAARLGNMFRQPAASPRPSVVLPFMMGAGQQRPQ